MSPVDWAGSVSKISPHHYFFCKNFNVSVHMRRQAGLVTEISVFPTKISVTGLEIFPSEQVSPVAGMKKIQIRKPCISVQGE